MSRYDCTAIESRAQGVAAAAAALARGDLVVLPTDTVYGVGADAFDAAAVARLLAAKGRGREKPPPVLVGDAATLEALAVEVPAGARALVAAHWPGALTIICRAQPMLVWDLGETAGTVALRMPDHPTALELLRRTGPLAVSSANATGTPPALIADAAEDALGEAVAVYLDAGQSPGGQASTIVDATSDVLRVVRDGAIDLATLRATVPGILGLGEQAPDVAGETSAGQDGARQT